MQSLPIVSGIEINKVLLPEQKSAPTSNRAGTSAVSDEKTKGFKNACAEFESLFIYYILKEMRASMPKGGYLGNSLRSETYTSLFDMQLAKELSLKGIGLTEFLEQQLQNRFKEIQVQSTEKSLDFD